MESFTCEYDLETAVQHIFDEYATKIQHECTSEAGNQQVTEKWEEHCFDEIPDKIYLVYSANDGTNPPNNHSFRINVDGEYREIEVELLGFDGTVAEYLWWLSD